MEGSSGITNGLLLFIFAQFGPKDLPLVHTVKPQPPEASFPNGFGSCGNRGVWNTPAGQLSLKSVKSNQMHHLSPLKTPISNLQTVCQLARNRWLPFIPSKVEASNQQHVPFQVAAALPNQQNVPPPRFSRPLSVSVIYH